MAQAPKTPDPSATTRVADAIQARAKRVSKIGPTVRVVATQRGYYGYPLPELRETGDVFAFAVKDLQSFVAGAKGPTGQLLGSITYGGKQYLLPSWCEDASRASRDSEEEDEDLEDGAPAPSRASASSSATGGGTGTGDAEVI